MRFRNRTWRKDRSICVSRRDPNQTYHKLTVHELVFARSRHRLAQIFRGHGRAAHPDLNVVVPNFFRTVESTIVRPASTTSKRTCAGIWCTRKPRSSQSRFVDENFHFYREILTGAKEIQPRWKRCVDATDSDLGFALGQKYVEQLSGPKPKRAR